MKALKNFILIAALIFVSLHAKAGEIGLKSYWELKNSIQYSSQYIRAYDSLVNPSSGAGYFVWIKNDNTAAIPDIPGIQIKPNRTSKGYWRRSDASLGVAVDWFGVCNKPTQKTWAEYGYTQARLDSIYAIFGASFTLTTDRPDGTAIRCAFALMERQGYQYIYFSPNIYYQERTAQLPKILSGALVADITRFIIQGRGAQITGITGMTGDFWQRYPTSHTQAATWIGAAFHISDVLFKGTQAAGSGQCAINIAATQYNYFLDIDLKQIDIGIRAEWCMHMTTQNTHGNQCKTYDMLFNYGQYSGGTDSGDQCNDTHILNHRTFGGGGIAGVKIVAASNCVIDGITGEGGGALYLINFDTHGSSVVKDFTIHNIYGEGEFDSAAVYVRGATLLATIDGVYFRGTVNVFMLDAISGYPQMNLRNISWWDGTMRIASRNPGTNNCFDLYNFDKTSLQTVTDMITPANNLFSTAGGCTYPIAARCRIVPKIVN